MKKTPVTTFRFEKGSKGMAVTASYDTGWNETLKMDGYGGWTDEVALNDHDAALFYVSNGRAKLSICGMKHWCGMNFSVIVLTQTKEGFEITEDETGVTVVCEGMFATQYERASPVPRS